MAAWLSLLTHPLAILVIGLATIVGMLLVLRVNAFVALITAAIVVSMLAPGEPAKKIDRVAVAFGTMAGKIGVLIALAAIIGKCLMESGGADRIVRSFLDLFGAARVPEALAAAAFLLAPLVFFGTAFYLIIPLARCFGRHTGKDYLLYVLAIGSGGAVTHVMVPPGAGPLLIAANLRVDLGTLIAAGTLIGVPTALLGLWGSRRMNRRMILPVRPYPGEQEREPPPVEELPGLAISLVPVVLPLALISADTLRRAFVLRGAADPASSAPAASLSAVMILFGNPNLALLVAAGIALVLVARTRRLSLAQLASVAEEGLTNCGVMILLVCAGGAFGAMLGEAQVGRLIEQVFPRGGSGSALATLWIAFAATVALKIVVGSSTVAIATSSGMLAALDTSAAALGCHPVYLAMAVGVGSLVFSWMNDPGFWLITRMSGMSETEALRSWTPWSAWLGLSGMLCISLAAWLLPLA
jgi:GntP family gluconate:H+ symporter